jgi:DNA-binding MarR family transcriptional regulator
MSSPSLSDPGDRQESPAVKLALGLFRVSQALANARGQSAADSGVSPLQLQILIDLAQQAGGARTAGALARRYGISAPTLSDSLAVLTRRKLVSARASASDARQRELGLTAKGRKLADRALGDLDQLVRVCGEMPREERERALSTTVDLIRRFNELGWIRSDRMCSTCRFFERDRAPQSTAPHWCRLIERPLAAADLRVDCPEHELHPDLAPS